MANHKEISGHHIWVLVVNIGIPTYVHYNMSYAKKCPVNVLNKSEICPSQVFLLILNSLLSFCRQIVQYSTFVPAFDSYMSSTFHKNVSKIWRTKSGQSLTLILFAYNQKLGPAEEPPCMNTTYVLTHPSFLR